MNITKEKILEKYKSNEQNFNKKTEELREYVFNNFSDFLKNEESLKKFDISLETNYGARLYSSFNDNGYFISLGYQSMKYLLVFSELASEELLPIIKNEDSNSNNLSELELRDILFKIFLTTIFLHELAHIVYGHIDYNSTETDIRKAFESEADAFSTQLMFAYLDKYEDVRELFANYCNDYSSASSLLRLFGYVESYYFGFLSIISKEISDFHPSPIKRRFCSMAASEEITKLVTPKGLSEEKFKIAKARVINIFIQAFHKIYPEKEYYIDMIETAEYMSNLDKILRNSNIKSFYKIGKDR
ncbi:MAG: hypothetical protein HXM21_10145 [Haemophilus influenzae]|jgi:hypothetical protein|nr:hypothetical protein [Haemophilus influenzae]